jgi:flavin reductase (DIM6/NTAB) family NADH-FMN oxidoreductase RutF
VADELSGGIDEPTFREAISHFASGVTVITTLHEGHPAGMTASAVSSLSLQPTLLLVCINSSIATHGAIEASGRFAVNVLGEGSDDLALRFARSSTDKFAGVALNAQHDLPVLDDAIAYFICDVHERFPGGDHSIFTGLVRDCGARHGCRPLVYFRSTFGSLHDREAAHQRELELWDAISYGITE